MHLTISLQFEFLDNIRHCNHHMPEDSLVVVRREAQLSQPLPILRDDEQVGWGLRADVVENEAVLVLLRV